MAAEQDRAAKVLTIDKIVGLDGPRDLRLSPDGQQVVFTLDVKGTRQLHVMPLAGGWPRRLTAELKDCSDPRWSPDGTHIAFVRDKAIWVMEADGQNQRRVTHHEAGNTAPRWSPDGKRLAFISRRRGWDQIWVVNLDGGEPVQLTRTPADNRDPQWSPDGRWIAYTSIRDDLLSQDIYLIPATGGEEVRLTTTRSLDSSPRWSPDGRRLAYLSDVEGWVHVWVMDVETRERRPVTSGTQEDGMPYGEEGVAPRWSPDGRQIAFVRNRDGMLDLMVVAADGGSPRRLFQEDGCHSLVGWTPDATRLVTVFESPVRPPDLWVVPLDGGSPVQVTHSLAGGIVPEALTVPERVQYRSRDGLDIYGYLYKPFEMRAGERYPALITPHGGPTWQFQFRWDPFLQYLAQEGYVILGPDFRGSTGYGNAFRQANFNEWGHGDLFDVVDGAAWLRTLAFVDPERLGIYGWSYGGYLTLCALTMTPEVFQVGVDICGDSELAESYRHGDREGRLDLHRQMGSPEEHPNLYRRGSPVYFAENIQAPLLILHGRKDMRVVPLMSEKMIEALKIEGKFYEAHFYEDEEHRFKKPANLKDAYERIIKFLNRHLKGEDEADEH